VGHVVSNVAALKGESRGLEQYPGFQPKRTGIVADPHL
jgi:hypothetical protein